MIQHADIIDFIIKFLTDYLKIYFSTLDLKNLKQYDYCKDLLILKSL